MESKIKDITLAEYGRKEIEQAEKEMPGLMAIRDKYGNDKPFKGLKISGCLHMTIQTAVLIETLKELGADIRWSSCNIYSTQDEAAAAIVKSKSAVVFAWKGETIEEYWDCVYNSLVWPDGTGPDLIVDDGCDATFLVHEGVYYEDRFESDGSYPILENDNEEVSNMMRVITNTLRRNKTFWRDMANKIIGVSEETTTGVKRLKELEKEGRLLFPSINVNDSVTKTKFDNLYGCKHSLVDSILRATDIMIAGKKALVCGYGDVGKGSVESLRSAGAIVYVTETDPICALQACMNGLEVVLIEDVLDKVDIFVTATGNCDIINTEHIENMKDGAILCNIGHFDNEIDVNGLKKLEGIKKINIKAQVDKYILKSGKSIVLLADGRLVNLGCATGHPSFVMSCSFSNQVLAQIELVRNKNYKKQVYKLDKKYDEEVALLHLDKLGAKLTKLSHKQCEYLGVNVFGPFKNNDYRY